MARKGEIVIRFVEGENKTPGPQPVNKQEETREKDDSLLKEAVLISLVQRTARQIKGLVVSEANYQINKHFTLTDNYLGQQNLNIALNVINKVWNTGLSIYTGYKVAGVPGAVAAAGVSVLSIAQQIYHNYEQEKINISKMNAQLKFNRQRSDYSLTAGARGENR